MICKYCQTENPENSTYCLKCGKRLDGKIVCNKCGTANPPEAAYCTKCGTRIDGKILCPKCDAAVEKDADFCPSCGANLKEIGAENTASAESKKRKALSFSANLCLLVSAVLAFIFTFCTGISGTQSQTATPINVNIYDYFGTAYDSIRNVLSLFAEVYNLGNLTYFSLSLYLPTIIGTIVSVAMIVGVAVMTIFAALRFAKFCQGKENSGVLPFAAIAYATFLSCACGMLALYYTSGKGTEIQKFGMHFNGATIAGIILGGIFLTAGIVLTLITNSKTAFSHKNIAITVGSLTSVVIVVLALSFATVGPISLTSEGSTLQYRSGTFMSLIGLNYLEDYYAEAPVGESIAFSVSVVAQIAAIVLAGFTLVRFIENACGRKKSTLAVSIPLFAVALVYLVSAIIFGNQSIYAIADTASTVYILTYGMAITFVVMCAVTLGLSITATVLRTKHKSAT